MPAAMPATPLPIIRAMTAHDIEAVGALAARIWRAYYPSILSDAQIDYMLARMYAPESLRDQLGQGHRFTLLEQDGALCGFASVQPLEGGRWFLHKFYIDQAQARRGLGSALMAELLAAHRPQEFSLHVNRANIPAINFYLRHGFALERVVTTDIGGGFVMDDFRMTRRA